MYRNPLVLLLLFFSNHSKENNLDISKSEYCKINNNDREMRVVLSILIILPAIRCRVL